ncbi:hypothetical protein ACEWY4_004344 [Coilia grayii]|uniref:Uncharacterized protein n=1 Tax=Coilia grayii TaxID=363190 RepID=A0ABD1KLF9_9TELE
MGLQTLHPLLLAAAVLTLWPLYLVHGAEPAVRAKVGSVAVLRCSLAPADVGSASPRHVVEWIRQGFDIPILIKFGAYAPRVHPDYEGRVSLMGDGALSVGALRLEDQGRYECRILPLEKTDGETRNGSWTLLTVYAPPMFTETSAAVVEALLRQPVSLRCVVRGNPTPQVTWTKNGVPLKQDNIEVRNGTVFFWSVSRESAGEYRCHASNSEGNVSHVTQLWVKGPPVIRVPPKDLALNVSQKAQLQCWAEADPPNMTYVWQREGENVYHIQSLKSRVRVLVDGTLLISGVTPEDSGNYTCTPTNGLLTPPSASAHLTVRHPAQVLQMPKETYLPTGMGGVIPCPVRAEPPLLRVDWTKDGKPLDLDTQYPGWTLTSQGSVSMATANEDAAGVYTCTPYNSYGTMGQSEPTRVILQDPPSFKVYPRKEYRQEVGRALEVPCQANGDPTPRVTWTKVGRSPSSSFSVAANGSLLLQPLSKDHQGAWQCSCSNRVATVNTSTTLLVLGTSPHAVSLLSVSAGLTHANVSWEPGFDGGYTQKFTIWLKRASSEAEREKQEWASVPVPPSAGTSFQVTGLQPSTEYQFSVLPQNKMGTGPFSDITSARTLDPQPVVLELAPPTFLSANVTAGGVLIRWEPPRGQSPPVESFVLQSRVEGAQWSVLAEDISANLTHMLVQGLEKDNVYELRLLSQHGDRLSRPSAPMTVSTAGLEVSEVSPASRGTHQRVPEPLLAGLVGGLALLCVALLLTIGLACVHHRRRAQRKRRREDPALLTSPSGTASAAGGSPDSVLKHKLLPTHSLSSTSSSSTSASSPSDPSSYDRSIHSTYHNSQQRGHHQQQQQPQPHFLPLPESTLSRGSRGWGGGGGGGSQKLSTLSPLELISRGPDGRFSLEPLTELPGSGSGSGSGSGFFSHMPIRRSLQMDFSRLPPPGTNRGVGGGGCGIQKSHSLRSHREERRERDRHRDRDAPFVLSVDLPPSSGHARSMAKHLSLQGHYFLDPQDLTPSVAELPECSSLLSEGSSSSSESDACSDPGPERGLSSSGYASLKRVSGGPAAAEDDGGPSAASLLVLQMEHERERGNLSRCLTLAREREALERELRKYSSDRHSIIADREPKLQQHQQQSQQKGEEDEEEEEEEEEDDPELHEHELMWITRRGVSPHSSLRASRGCYSPGHSGRGSTRPSSCVLWEASPLASPTHHLVQVHTPPPPPPPVPLPPPQEADRQWSGPDGQRTKRSPLVGGGVGLALHPERERPRRELESPRRGCVSPDRLSVAAGSRRQGVHQEAVDTAERTGTRRRGGTDGQGEEGGDIIRGHPAECTFVEMSVDGPEIEERYHAVSLPARAVQTLGRRDRDRQHTHRDAHTLQRMHARGAIGDTQGKSQSSRTLSHMDVQRPDLRKTGSLGPQCWAGHKSTQSLDSRRKGEFLTPDAWIHSLSLSTVSGSSFSSPLQYEDVGGEPYRETPQAHSRGIPNPQSGGEPQNTPSRSSVTTPHRRTPKSPGRTPDPRRQASTLPREFRGHPDTMSDTAPRGPHGRGHPTPDRHPTSDRHPIPDRGDSPHKPGYRSPDRGKLLHTRGPSPLSRSSSSLGRQRHLPERSLSPQQRGLPLPDRGQGPPNGLLRPPSRLGEAYAVWQPDPWASSSSGRDEEQARRPGEEVGVRKEEEGEEERGENQEADDEIRRYRNAAAESEGSYRSYASQSSGRGSLDPPNSLSPPLTSSPSSPETTEDSEHEEKAQQDSRLHRRTSTVDESYEWDSQYVSMKPVYMKPAQVQQSLDEEEEREGEEEGWSHPCRADGEMTRGGGGGGGGEKGGGMFPSVRLLKPGGSLSSVGLPRHHHAQAEPDAVLF